MLPLPPGESSQHDGKIFYSHCAWHTADPHRHLQEAIIHAKMNYLKCDQNLFKIKTSVWVFKTPHFLTKQNSPTKTKKHKGKNQEENTHEHSKYTGIRKKLCTRLLQHQTKSIRIHIYT